MKGLIVFMTSEKGTKSEGIYPYLYKGNGEFVRVYKEGDNPFENRELKKYDAECVELEGEFNENREFIVSAISLATSCATALVKQAEDDEEEFIPVPDDEEIDTAVAFSPEEEVGKEFILVPDEGKKKD